jgi:hypothetical protein
LMAPPSINKPYTPFLSWRHGWTDIAPRKPQKN